MLFRSGRERVVAVEAEAGRDFLGVRLGHRGKPYGRDSVAIGVHGRGNVVGIRHLAGLGDGGLVLQVVVRLSRDAERVAGDAHLQGVDGY